MGKVCFNTNMGKYNRPTKTTKENTTKGSVAVHPSTPPKPPVVKTKNAKTNAIPQRKEEAKSMNIFEKMQAIRAELAASDIKRSSQNADKGFSYMELADYLPLITKLSSEYGIMTQFNMTAERGVLKIYNTSNPSEVLEWEVPTAELKMDDAEGVQIMKGKTTYMRRTLFEIAFEISVKDTVDAQAKSQPTPAEELDERDIAALDEASDLEHLNTIAQNIRNRKGFNKNKALLKWYTKKKAELQK